MVGTLALAAVLGACDDDSTGPDDQETFTFSFEDDLQGWAAQGIDLDDPPVTWAITQSEDTSTAGDGSAKFVLDNLNDAGKIFLERAFELEPDTEYDVRIAFDFASADWGDQNHWTIIAGAHAAPPEDRDDLRMQGNTANGEDEEGEHVWLEKSYDLQVTSDDEGNVVIAVGVWGTYEVERTYYIDDLRITFTER
jgi:hypothetical protein